MQCPRGDKTEKISKYTWKFEILKHPLFIFKIVSPYKSKLSSIQLSLEEFWALSVVSPSRNEQDAFFHDGQISDFPPEIFTEVKVEEYRRHNKQKFQLNILMNFTE